MGTKRVTFQARISDREKQRVEELAKANGFTTPSGRPNVSAWLRSQIRRGYRDMRAAVGS